MRFRNDELAFKKLFEEAEIAKFSKTELREYEDSLKAYRDVKNSIDTALEQGRAEGADMQKTNIAKMMIANGEPVEKIALYTGLTAEKIGKL